MIELDYQDIEQQTPEWLEMRRNKIGASDAIIIMGVSPWKTPNDLFLDKMGLSPTQYRSPAMQRGIDLESDARKECEYRLKENLYPKVVFNKDLPWQMASLDGISLDGKILVEIKCPGKSDHECALGGEVPEKYFPQLQHQMCVCGLDEMYYFSYFGITASNALIKVHRDQEYIDKLTQKEREFWNCMQTFTAPELTPRDYNVRNDSEWKLTALEMTTVQKFLKEYETRHAQLKEKLIQLADGKNSVGNGVKLCKVVKKGTVDYMAIPGVSQHIENYRKSPVEYWKISTEKD